MRFYLFFSHSKIQSPTCNIIKKALFNSIDSDTCSLFFVRRHMQKRSGVPSKGRAPRTQKHTTVIRSHTMQSRGAADKVISLAGAFRKRRKRRFLTVLSPPYAVPTNVSILPRLRRTAQKMPGICPSSPQSGRGGQRQYLGPPRAKKCHPA